MARKSSNRIGKMIRQKSKNGNDYAIVRIRIDNKPKTFYLGRWGSEKAEAEYRSLAREYYSESRTPIPINKEPKLYDVYSRFIDDLENKNDEADKRCYRSAIWYAMQILPNIPCRELEAWYWGDLDAVSAAFNKDLSSYKKKKKYRKPDEIVDPKEKLKKLIPELQQQSGAKAIGKQASKRPLNENASPSFQAFIKGVQKLCET